MPTIDHITSGLQDSKWLVGSSSDDQLIQKGGAVELGHRSRGLVSVSWRRHDTAQELEARAWVADYDAAMQGVLQIESEPSLSISFASMSSPGSSRDKIYMFGMVRPNANATGSTVWSAANQVGGTALLACDSDGEKWLKRHRRPLKDWVGRVFKVVACSPGNPPVKIGCRVLIFEDEIGNYDIMSTPDPVISKDQVWKIYDTDMTYCPETSTLRNDHRAIAYFPGRAPHEKDCLYAMYDTRVSAGPLLPFEGGNEFDDDEGVWGAEEGGG